MKKITHYLNLTAISLLFLFISLLFTGCGMTDEEKQAALDAKLVEVKKGADDIAQTEALYSLCMQQLLNPTTNHSDLKDKLDGLNYAAYKRANAFEEIDLPDGIEGEKKEQFKKMKKSYYDACSSLSLLANDSAEMIKQGKFDKYTLDNLVSQKERYFTSIQYANQLYQEFTSSSENN